MRSIKRGRPRRDYYRPSMAELKVLAEEVQPVKCLDSPHVVGIDCKFNVQLYSRPCYSESGCSVCTTCFAHSIDHLDKITVYHQAKKGLDE